MIVTRVLLKRLKIGVCSVANSKELVRSEALEVHTLY